MSHEILQSKKDNSLKKIDLFNTLKKEFKESILDYHSHRGDETVLMEGRDRRQVCAYAESTDADGTHTTRWLGRAGSA